MSASLASGVITLSKAEVAGLVHDHPELGGNESGPAVVAITLPDAAQATAFVAVVSLLRERLGHDRDAADRALNALIPDQVLMPSAVLEQTHRDAAGRIELATEFGLLSSTEVAHQAGSRAMNTNPASLANRWRSQHKVFTVDIGGVQRYPGFQFDEETGRPLPVIEGVTAALGDLLGGWELALWFTTSNSRLGGLRPVDVLDTDAALVTAAAAAMAAELTG